MAAGAFIGIFSAPFYLLSKEFATQATSLNIFLGVIFTLLIIILIDRASTYYKVNL
jgi:hypothetical protein